MWYACFPVLSKQRCSQNNTHSVRVSLAVSLLSLQQKSDADRRLHEKENEVVSMNLRHAEDVDRLRADMSIQKQNYERKIQEKEASLRTKERDLEAVQQSLQSRQSDKEGEVETMRLNLDRAQNELQTKEHEM